MASTMPRHIELLLLLLVSARAASAAGAGAGACAAEKFPAGRTYAKCEDLPQLGASLHWTHDESKSSLSLAFVAAPAGPNGWVAWGLNPTGEGMAGAQALVALKGSGAAAPTVKTYNITGYVPLGGASTPIAFPATDLAADSGSGGKIRLYGKLQLHKGMKEVNQIWQVGTSVTGGAPDKHPMTAGNLASKSKLVLAGKATSAASPSPAPAPVAGGPSGSAGSDSGAAATTAPSAGKSPSAAATVGVSAPALIVLALLGLLTIV